MGPRWKSRSFRTGLWGSVFTSGPGLVASASSSTTVWTSTLHSCHHAFSAKTDRGLSETMNASTASRWVRSVGCFGHSSLWDSGPSPVSSIFICLQFRGSTLAEAFPPQLNWDSHGCWRQGLPHSLGFASCGVPWDLRASHYLKYENGTYLIIHFLSLLMRRLTSEWNKR